jgi:histone H3/H4
MPKQKEIEMMVTTAAVKRRIKEHGDVNVAGDFAAVLNREVDDLLRRAVQRCTNNGRKTVRGADL